MENAVCPKCGCIFETDTEEKTCKCPYCANIMETADAMNFYTQYRRAKPELEENSGSGAFLTGISLLALGNYQDAAQCFLTETFNSPESPRYWLYLLYALTEKFEKIYLVASKDATRNAGNIKIICYNVYLNFIETADEDDYDFVYKEMGIDLKPENLWSKIIYDAKDEPNPTEIWAGKMAPYVEFAYKELKKTGLDVTNLVKEELNKKLNPIKDGVLEINTMMFSEPSEEGLFSVTGNMEAVEFAGDTMEGSEKFKAFYLTENIKNLGTYFPFNTIRVAEGVKKIEKNFMYCAEKLEKVYFSSTVTEIGEKAFYGCLNLTAAEFCEGLKSIGDYAFFGTAIKCSVLPTTTNLLGKSIFGQPERNEKNIDISKYIYVISKQSSASSKEWNRVGPHRAGYIFRNKHSFLLEYPEKNERTSDGGYKNLEMTDDENMIFKALACSYADFLPGNFKSSIGEKIARLFGKNKKISKSSKNQ